MAKRRNFEEVLFRGGLAKGFQLFLLFARNILIIPILLSTWGAEKFGLWIAIISFFDLLSSLDAGHNTYIANEFNRHYFLDKQEAKHLLGSCVKVIYLSGIIQFFIVTLLFKLNAFNFMFPTALESMDALFIGVLSLFAFRFFIGSLKGVMIKTVFPLGYMDRAIYLRSGERIIEVIILIVAGLYHFSIMETCIYFAILKFIYALLSLMLVKKWMPEFFPWWQHGNIRTGIKNYMISLSLTFNFFVDRFSRDGLNLLISATIGLAALPVFTTIKTLINFATQVTNSFMGPLQPEFIRFHASKQWMKIVESMKANWLISNLILNIPFVIAIFFIEDLYHIWTDHTIQFDFKLFGLLVISVLIYNYGNSYMTYLRGINYIKGLLVFTVVRSFFLFGFSVVFVKSMGLVGVGLATLISEIVTSIIIPYYYVNKTLSKHNYKIRLQDRILPLVAIALVAAVYVIGDRTTWLLPSSFICVLLLIFLTIRQWKNLHTEVRHKVEKTFSKISILRSA